MSAQQKDLDPTPLVDRLLEKSLTGKLRWEPTADPKVFVASIGGEATFKIRLVDADHVDEYGRPVTVEVPRLDMVDDKGRVIWDIRNSDVKGPVLQRLWQVARRIGNRLDERLATTLQALERL